MTPRKPRNDLGLLALLLVALVLQGCGGGGSSSSPGRQSEVFALGPVDQVFDEAVTVNDVRFDTVGAGVTVDGRPATRDRIRRGHIACIRGHFDRGGWGTARQIEVESIVIGPVQFRTEGAERLRVMGQIVLVDRHTQIDPEIREILAGGGIVDETLRVSGHHGRDGVISATRIEPPPAQSPERVLGTVEDLDADNSMFKINDLRVSYRFATIVGLPGSSPPDGSAVAVTGTLQQGLLIADEVAASRLLEEDDFGTEVRLHGFITRFESVVDFSVGSIRVATSPSTEYYNGTIHDLRLGARISVEGTFDVTTVQADRVTFDRPRSETSTIRFPFSDFDEVDVGNAFRVHVDRAAKFDVAVSVDQDVVPFLSVTQDGGVLRVGLVPHEGNIESETLELRVRMPSLRRVELRGAANAFLDGFEETELHLHLVGAANLRAGDLSVQRLSLRLAAASNVDLPDVRSVDEVDLELTGACNATVNVIPRGFIGGTLTFGSNLYYYGDRRRGRRRDAAGVDRHEARGLERLTAARCRCEKRSCRRRTDPVPTRGS